jgi:hypothetical protein
VLTEALEKKGLSPSGLDIRNGKGFPGYNVFTRRPGDSMTHAMQKKAREVTERKLYG